MIRQIARLRYVPGMRKVRPYFEYIPVNLGRWQSDLIVLWLGVRFGGLVINILREVDP